MAKPSIPKGTRDFLPREMNRRNFIFDTIRAVFKNYGYQPIETPAMEKTETLMGKYGEEGDRLIFRILNSGDFLSKIPSDAGESSQKMAAAISEKALRYDLTVPFARLVVQNQNEITFPFKRFQIQPVWRADRPQKGRYREFFQCDADVVGSDSLLYEVELVQIFDEVLSRLGLDDFTIQVNNRKILSGIAEVAGEQEKIVDITVAIDKLDKMGVEKVKQELSDKGVSANAIEKISPLFELEINGLQAMDQFEEFLEGSQEGNDGLEELRTVFELVNQLGLNKAKIQFNPLLARGLNYYTGAIFEVKANNVNIGSICGGGRYDDLTGVFGMPGMSGVGISFGADRIYDVMTELNIWPENLDAAVKLMFVNFEETQNYCLELLREIRANGICAEIYPSAAKMKKQMKYANDKGCEFVAMVGSEELQNQMITLKNMATGDQDLCNFEELLKKLS